MTFLKWYLCLCSSLTFLIWSYVSLFLHQAWTQSPHGTLWLKKEVWFNLHFLPSPLSLSPCLSSTELWGLNWSTHNKVWRKSCIAGQNGSITANTLKMNGWATMGKTPRDQPKPPATPFTPPSTDIQTLLTRQNRHINKKRKINVAQRPRVLDVSTPSLHLAESRPGY